MKNHADLFATTASSPCTAERCGDLPVTLDTRLIAAVQSRAGARCHQAASLLHVYYMCADVYRAKLHRGDHELARAALGRLHECERRLRDFLSTSPAPTTSRTPDWRSPAFAHPG